MLSSIYCAVTTATAVTLEDVHFLDSAGNAIPFGGGSEIGTLTVSSTGRTLISSLWETATSEEFQNHLGLYDIVSIKARSTGKINFYTGSRVDDLQTFQVLAGEVFVLGPPKPNRIVLSKIVQAGNSTESLLSDPALGAIAINAGTDGLAILPLPRALFVGTGGNVNVRMADGTDIIFYNVSDGSLLPIRPYMVQSTSTTASNMVGLY